MRHVVQFSSGAGSWAAAKLVAQRFGTGDLVLLFADTQTEDADNYRFLVEGWVNVGGRLVVLSDGRDVWQVFHDVRFLANSRIDPCSRILKREPLRKWLEDNCDPEDTISYLGHEWDEPHRVEKMEKFWAPWRVEAPLAQELMSKEDALAWCRSEGIAPPDLYRQGFRHANCGGFCVKGGQGHFATLLRENRSRYLYHEAKEEELSGHLGKKVTILRDRTDATTTPLSMREFRKRMDAQPSLFDLIDEDEACDCMTPPEQVA